jgi:hypothetical protein
MTGQQYWWSKDMYDATNGYSLFVYFYTGEVVLRTDTSAAGPNALGFSVRCIKDLTISACSATTPCGSPCTYGGETYGTASYAGTCWFLKNLNTGTQLASLSTQPSNPSGVEKWCYNDDANSCNTYGGLYKQSEAATACPSGWRLPTKQEITNLIGTSGAVAGMNFSYGGWASSIYWGSGSFGYYWGSDFFNSTVWGFDYYLGSAAVFNYDPAYGFSVRCVK